MIDDPSHVQHHCYWIILPCVCFQPVSLFSVSCAYHTAGFVFTISFVSSIYIFSFTEIQPCGISRSQGLASLLPYQNLVVWLRVHMSRRGSELCLLCLCPHRSDSSSECCVHLKWVFVSSTWCCLLLAVSRMYTKTKKLQTEVPLKILW